MLKTTIQKRAKEKLVQPYAFVGSASNLGFSLLALGPFVILGLVALKMNVGHAEASLAILISIVGMGLHWFFSDIRVKLKFGTTLWVADTLQFLDEANQGKDPEEVGRVRQELESRLSRIDKSLPGVLLKGLIWLPHPLLVGLMVSYMLIFFRLTDPYQILVGLSANLLYAVITVTSGRKQLLQTQLVLLRIIMKHQSNRTTFAGQGNTSVAVTQTNSIR